MAVALKMLEQVTVKPCNCKHEQLLTGTSLRALLSIPCLLYLRGWSTIVAISRRSTSAVTSGGRGWI